MNVAVRVDASLKIGIGHLMRCLALTEELTRRGNCCHIISKIEDSALHRKIKNLNIIFKQLKSDITLSEEIGAVITYSKKKNIDWIITDHYKINTNYNKIIKQNGFKILSIDDNSQIYYYSDVVLNQNIGSEKLKFFSEKYTKFLLGNKYVLIRDELLNSNLKKRKAKVEKILITLGGSDYKNYTLSILQAMESIDENIKFLIVIGPFNPFYEILKDYVKETDLNIDLIKSPKNMRDIYIESDMAISAAGSSCYELAYFGIPNIIITIAENQLQTAYELNKNKICIFEGKKNELKMDNLKKMVKELKNNSNLLNSMSQNSRRLVDGKGKKRVVDFMERVC